MRAVSQFNPIPEIRNLLLAILIIPELYSSSPKYTYHPRYLSSQNYTHNPRTILIIPEQYSSSQSYTHHPRTLLIIPELHSSSRDYIHHPGTILIIAGLCPSCPKLFRVVLTCIKLFDSLFPNGFFVRSLIPIQSLFPYFRYCYGSQLYSCCSASCPLGR